MVQFLVYVCKKYLWGVARRLLPVKEVIKTKKITGGANTGNGFYAAVDVDHSRLSKLTSKSLMNLLL